MDHANVNVLLDTTLNVGATDGNGDVDVFDEGIWQTNFPTAPAGPANVPEPATWTLLALCVPVMMRRWGRSV